MMFLHNSNIERAVRYVGLMFCLLILFSTTKLQADSGQIYRLDELIELGLEKSVDRQTQELQLQNSKSSLTSTYLDFLPSASLRASREFSKDERQSAGFSLSKGISLNEPTYFNWRRAKIDWDNANLSYEDNRKKVVFEVFTRYIAVAEAEQRVNIQKKNLAIQEKIMEQMELLHRLEQRSLLELKQAQISLINVQINLEDAELSLKNARENLFIYLNIDDEGYPFEDINIPLMDVIPEYRKTQDIIQAENDMLKSGLTLTQSKLNFFPQLSLNYAYNYSRSVPVEENLFDFDKYGDNYSISLSASYPLFNYFNNREQHNRNKRSLKSQELMLDNLMANNKKKYEQMIRNLEREKRLFALSEQKNALAEESLELAQNRFNMGLLSLLELEQVMKDYYETTIETNTRYYQRLLKQEELNLFLSDKLLGQW